MKTRQSRSAGPYTTTHEHDLAQIDRVAKLLDARFRLPIIGVRVGWDGILGLIPGIGDLAMTAPSAWILWKAHRMGASKPVLFRMAMNAGLDFAVGSVPLVGDIFDIAFKGNLRNVRLLQDHLRRPPRD